MKTVPERNMVYLMDGNKKIGSIEILEMNLYE
jgi:hypothetical protein